MGHGRTWAKWAVVAVGAVLFGLLAWERFRPVYPTAVLASFVGDARWSEGRSALDLPWRPYDAEEKVPDYTHVLIALYKKKPSDERELKLAMAQLYLWRAETGDFQRAEDHVAAFPEDAEALNEHALVLLARGKPIEALNTVLAALNRAPELPAALFNRAMLMERLVLRGGATDAWHAFLGVESEGPWAAEARKHLAALQDVEVKKKGLEAQVADFGKRLRALESQSDLNALLADPSTNPLLDDLAEQSELLFQTEIDFLRGLDGSGWRQRGFFARRYAEEFERVLAGRADLWRIEEAGRLVQDPMLTVYFHRLALYEAVQRSDLDSGRRLERAIQSLCMTHGCAEAAVLANSDLASLLHESGRTHEADEALERAEQQLLPSSTQRRAELLLKRASWAQKAGAAERATGLAAEAVQLAPAHGDDLSLASALLNVGWYSAIRGMPAVAAAYAGEARVVAERAGIARVAQMATGNLAEALLAEGRLAEAARLLEKTVADATETAIPSALQGNRLLLARLRLHQGRNEEAVALADLFIAGAPQTGQAKELPSVLFLKARAHFGAGSVEAGALALHEAVLAANRYVELTDSPLAARSLAGEFAPIVATYATWLANQGDSSAAWALLGERALRALDPDECFVAQVRLEDGWGEWVADESGTRFRRLAAQRSPLDPAGCPPTTRRLTILDGIVADASALSRMVRLANPEIAVVLSARTDTPWPGEDISGTGLVVHSPQPVRLDLGLGFLPAAPREAAVVMRTLPGSVELRDGAATPAAVTSLSSEHALLHFAVHGVSSTASDAASFLLLGGETGHLEVVDILDMPLEKKRPVVVLTACKSGGAEGSVELNGGGLTWAFREAGARAVIAYQDNLKDAAALLFSEAFYAALAEGAGLSAAFERGVARVRERHSPSVAAAFVLAI